MKYVIDATVAEAWYVSNSHTAKAMRLRFDFLRSVHGLLVPDIFPADSAQTLVNAERKGVIPSGRAQIELHDMQFLGIPVLPSYPLLERASTIALATKLKVFASLYIALAEREQCQPITADQKLLRAVRRHFSFVVPLASFP
jgi:predicted nucleic acid-binding protein